MCTAILSLDKIIFLGPELTVAIDVISREDALNVIDKDEHKGSTDGRAKLSHSSAPKQC